MIKLSRTRTRRMLHVMALNFSFVVPKEVVGAEGPDFTHNAGRHRRLQDGGIRPAASRIVLERNAGLDIKQTAGPIVDKITLPDRPGAGDRPCCASQKNEVGHPGRRSFPPAKYAEVIARTRRRRTDCHHRRDSSTPTT